MNLLLIISLIGIFFTLKWISDHLEEACATIAHKLKIPASIAGATLLAVSSSAPEFFTSLSSAVFQGIFEIGLITIIWSAIFNILVLPGSASLYAKKGVYVAKNGIARDIIFYLGAIFLLIISIWDQTITRHEAAIYLVYYFVYIFVLLYQRKSISLFDDIRSANASNIKIWLSFTMGIAAIGFLCWGMIEAGLKLAQNFNISLTIISAIIFAIGTSIPDLFLSISAAKKGSQTEAIANAFGSNTFDIAIGLGVPILIVGNIQINTTEIFSSILMLLAATIIVGYSILKDWQVTRQKGLIFLCLFLIYIIILLAIN